MVSEAVYYQIARVFNLYGMDPDDMTVAEWRQQFAQVPPEILEAAVGAMIAKDEWASVQRLQGHVSDAHRAAARVGAEQRRIGPGACTRCDRGWIWVDDSTVRRCACSIDGRVSVDTMSGPTVTATGTSSLIKRLWAEVRSDRPAHDHRQGDDQCPRCAMGRDQRADEERAIWADVQAHLRGGGRPPDEDTWHDRNAPVEYEDF